MTALTTPLCRQLGIEVPVAQAPIGSAVTTDLVAAVADAGGLGTLALTWVTAEEAVRRIREVRRSTPRPFAVNLVLDFPVDELLDACLAESVPVISTFWGDPSAVAGRVHSAGAVHLHTVGSVAEAEAAVAAGVDVIVAQGCEAGGHVRGETTTMALVPAVVDAVHPARHRGRRHRRRARARGRTGSRGPGGMAGHPIPDGMRGRHARGLPPSRHPGGAAGSRAHPVLRRRPARRTASCTAQLHAQRLGGRGPSRRAESSRRRHRGGPRRRRTGLAALRGHGARARHVGRPGGSRPLRGPDRRACPRRRPGWPHRGRHRRSCRGPHADADTLTLCTASARPRARKYSGLRRPPGRSWPRRHGGSPRRWRRARSRRRHRRRSPRWRDTARAPAA